MKNPNGLLAAGGDLSVGRLLEAYRRGVFPWYSAPEPILWWSPDPRMVLHCDELKVSRSLAKNARNKGYEVRVDTLIMPNPRRVYENNCRQLPSARHNSRRGIMPGFMCTRAVVVRGSEKRGKRR